MAYTKNFCQPVRMESQFVQSKLHHVIVQNSSDANIEIGDGALVTSGAGDFIADPVYSTAFTRGGGTAPAGLQVRKAVPTTAATATGVMIIDLATVSTKEGQGMTVRDGSLTIGLKAEAGTVNRARLLCEYDTLVIGEDNCTGALTVGQFATAAADGEFAPAATAPESGFYAEVIDKYTVSQGVDGSTTGLGAVAYRIAVVRN